MSKSKRLLAFFLSVLMVFGLVAGSAFAFRDWWHPDMDPGLQPELFGLARQAAVESIVMLENDNAEGTNTPVLPLAAGTNVAVFGRHQINYFFVGYGSGGDVRFPFATNLLQALRRHPDINVNENVAEVYEAWSAAHPLWGGGWAAWPRSHPEMPLQDMPRIEARGFIDAAGNPVATAAEAEVIPRHPLVPDDLAAQAAAESDVAVVVIGRAAGEDRDTLLNRRPWRGNANAAHSHYWYQEGSWYLTDREVAMLEHVTDAFDDVIVLINSGNIIDMSWLGMPAGFVHDCSATGNWTAGVENPLNPGTGMLMTGHPLTNLHEHCIPGHCVYERYDDIDRDSIKSVLYVWNGGMDAGPAVVDVLIGEQSPSGRMFATIANTIYDYPSTHQSGYMNHMQYANYVEDVFVGYRYFETFNHAAVRYSFGFGLSYSTFDITVDNSRVIQTPGSNVPGHYGWGPSDEIELVITVENTGDHTAKEVVQVYHSSPQSELAKPARELIAYAKTNLLLPGASETITIRFDVNEMSAFADFNIGTAANPIEHAWVLEAGDYHIFVGTSVCDTRAGAPGGTPVFTYNVPATRVTNQLSEALAVPADLAFDRFAVALDAGGNPIPGTNGPYTLTMQPVPTKTLDLEARILADMPTNRPNLPYRHHSLGLMPVEEIRPLSDVLLPDGSRNPAFTLEQFMAQMTVRELVELTRGGGPMNHFPGVPGQAGVFGGHAARLRHFGIAPISCLDGPSGLRMHAPATLLPMASALAATWNDRLVEDLYAALGREMLRNGADVLLAPGMDVQRTPLNGRNFEYFSECALLNGNMGANAVRGVHSEGVATSPKHFTANNQEGNRYNHDSRVSARALREIYIKGYENIINNANLQATMGAYNLINGIFAHLNYELNWIVMRQHLNFEGIIMTDWWLRHDPPVNGGRPENHVSRAYSREFHDGPPVQPVNNMPLMPTIPDELRGGPGTGLDLVVQPPDGSRLAFSMNAYRVRGGLDLLMPGNQFWGHPGGQQANPPGLPGWWQDQNPDPGRDMTPWQPVNWTLNNPMSHYLAGTMEIGEIQTAAYNVLNFALKVARFRIDNELPLYDFGPMIPMFRVDQERQEMPLLDNLFVDGRPLLGFDPLVTDYVVFARDINNLPVLTAAAPAGVTYTISEPVVGPNYTTVTITTSSPEGLEKIYRVHFTDRAGLTPMVPNPTLARLASISVDGAALLDFHPLRFNYTAQVQNLSFANVTAVPAPGVDVESITRDGNVVTIRVVSDHQAMYYVVTLIAQANPIPIVDITASGSSRVRTVADRFFQSWTGTFAGNNLDPDGPGITPGGTNQQHLVMTTTGRFALYNLNVERAGYYTVTARFASNFGEIAFQPFMDLFVGAEEAAPSAQIPYEGTGGLGTAAGVGPGQWETSRAATIHLEEGLNKLKLRATDGSFNINWLEFTRDYRRSLEALVEYAEELNERFYTADTWADLQDALADARAALANPGATEAEVDAAYDALRDAIDNLEHRVLFPDTLDHWSRPYVLEAHERGIILREIWCDIHDNYIFQPSADTTRAMAADFIWRTAGAPAPASNIIPFTDVTATDWFVDAVLWAYENDIIRGRAANDGTFYFAPEDTLERRELSTMLKRLAAHFGVDTTVLPGHPWPAFDDHDDIGWAEPYIRWNFAVGLLLGDNYNNVHPQRDTERAEAVTTVVRFARVFVD